MQLHTIIETFGKDAIVNMARLIHVKILQIYLILSHLNQVNGQEDVKILTIIMHLILMIAIVINLKNGIFFAVKNKKTALNKKLTHQTSSLLVSRLSYPLKLMFNAMPIKFKELLQLIKVKLPSISSKFPESP